MANKTDRQYFENFIEAAECACQAATYLIECLSDYDPNKMDAMLERMHEVEHAGDQKKHEMSIALAKAFVTPFDREDLAELSQCIDDVTDAIEEILQRFFIHHIRVVAPEAITFAKKIHACCILMKQMLAELETFKKPEHLRDMAIRLNHAEEDCDQFYLMVSSRVRGQYNDVLDVISWREIYGYMEDCADACEHVADLVETVVMKNT